MLYCPVCQVLCEDQCPLCGNRKLVQPKAEDPARLVTAQGQQADRLENLLQSRKIPYEKRPALSAGGTGAAKAYNYYVPCCRWEEGMNAETAAFPDADSVGKDAPDVHHPPAGLKPQTYRVGGEEFEVLPRKKQTFWRAVSILLLIVVVIAVVLLTDAAAGWLKSLFASKSAAFPLQMILKNWSV